MNILFEESITDTVKEKYILLELDTFYFTDTDKSSVAFCLVENIPIQEMLNIDQFLDLHKNLLKNYRLKNWKFCEDALEHLIGKWNNELDTFYESLTERIQQFKNQDPGPDWNGLIKKNF
jgi:hypothetical protein